MTTDNKITGSLVYGKRWASWPAKVCGPKPTQAEIDVAAAIAVACRKRPGNAVEFQAWCLYARKQGATRHQVQTACNSGPAFNRVRAAHDSGACVFTQGKAAAGDATVYRLTLPVKAAPRKRSAKRPAKAAKAAKAQTAKADATS